MQSNYEAKLLIVEDEGDNLYLLSSVLEKIFPKVTLYTAHDGQEGLEKFKEHEPDIVLTDLNLPKISGMRLAEEVRSLKPETRIIVITGQSERTEVEASSGKELAADHFLVKPIDVRELLNIIAS